LATRSMKGSPSAFLVPLPAETFSRAVQLDQPETYIGRAHSNTIRLAHGAVSRAHARVALVNGKYVLSDLNSRNGTFVNRRRISRAVLKHNDTIHFGNRAFVFKIESSAEPAQGAVSSIGAPETVSITDEGIDPSDLLAREAEAAAHTFLQSSEREEPDDSDATHLAHQRLYMLYHLSEQLRSGGDPETVLNRGLDLVFEALSSAQHAVALLREEETFGPLEVRAVRARHPISGSEPIPISRTVLDRVITERVAVISRDTLEDARFETSESIRVHNLKSLVCAPLMAGQRVIGAIHLDTSDFLNPLTSNDLEFVAAVANEMAMSIENHRLQENVIRNERMAAIGMTVTNVAHNLKNLLHLSMNAVGLMNQYIEEHEDERIHTRWHLVRQCLERMNRLAADMLEFARVEPKKQAWTDVNVALYDNRDFFGKSLSRQGIRIHWDLTPDLPEIFMDPSQLQRAILNLVVNAEDALTGVPNGRITVSTAMDDHRRLIIRVADNGCGIEEQDLDKIFQLFYTTKGSGGSGLGLPMVQKFVKGAGGKVTVTSRVGEGTTFSMFFPTSGEERATAETF